VDDGAGNNVTTFYTSFDGVTWTVLGSPVVQVGTTAILPYTSALIIGADNGGGGGGFFIGKMYQVLIYDGANATAALDMDMSMLRNDWKAGDQAIVIPRSGPTFIFSSTVNSGMRFLPEKWENPSPVFLLGTDDYMEVQGSAQHAALGMARDQSFTVLGVARQFATPPSSGAFVTKGNYSGPGPRWWLGNNGATLQGSMSAHDGVTSALTVSGAYAGGALQVVMGWVNRATARLMTALSGNVTSPVSSDVTNVGSLVNRMSTRLGTSSDGSVYNDMEFVAAAIFRRVLTPREIDLVCRYYGTVWS
jgi:hypothetical protein